MIQITSWNDGFETHDSRKTRGKLSWVRQNILMGDVAWAKLWLRPDAPEIWAGWTALVWASAQAETRGTTTTAEDVALVSRVPQKMVEKAIEWALSNGFAQVSGDLPGKLPQHSRNLPDDLPIDSRQSPDDAGNHPDYSTVQDSTRQDRTGQDEQTDEPKKQASVVREVVEFWNESIKGTAFPSARHTDPRAKVIATRAKDPSWFDDFKSAIAYIKTDSFYQGSGSTSWVANIDYLLQVGKATELAEKATARPVVQKTLKPQINGFTPEMYGGANAPDQW